MALVAQHPVLLCSFQAGRRPWCLQHPPNSMICNCIISPEQWKHSQMSSAVSPSWLPTDHPAPPAPSVNSKGLGAGLGCIVSLHLLLGLGPCLDEVEGGACSPLSINLGSVLPQKAHCTPPQVSVDRLPCPRPYLGSTVHSQR